MTQTETKGNIILRRLGKKLKPTPPAPQNQLRRFQFFTGANGKGYSKEKIHYEMQRFAFTREGNKLFRSMKKQQSEKMKQPESGMKILPQKKTLFGAVKNVFKSMRTQRGN